MSSLPDNQDTFLQNLRRAVGAPEDTIRNRETHPELFPTPDDQALLEKIANRNDGELDRLVDNFKDNGTLLNLHTHVVADLATGSDQIEKIILESEVEFGQSRHVVQHAHPVLAELRLWEKLADSPVSLHTTYPQDPQLREKTLRSYIGLTVADWGVAESATLLQITSSVTPRSTSLVPSIHIGILFREHLLESLTEMFVMLRHRGVPRSFTCISGPSKTADIEAHMVHGAHGPKEMHAILINAPANESSC